MIFIKRVYEPATAEDGQRFLVDRLWPRGVKKDALKYKAWVKEIAPSDALRTWFGHDPDRWCEFNERYFAELMEEEVLPKSYRTWVALKPKVENWSWEVGMDPKGVLASGWFFSRMKVFTANTGSVGEKKKL